mmetsp:Transcript_78972/g.211977  ORF Transcript_78972/g.211977 Transcript_78972/m.211977 type:complete len:85 (-) Transcript_78972:585-839(-)
MFNDLMILFTKRMTVPCGRARLQQESILRFIIISKIVAFRCDEIQGHSSSFGNMDSRPEACYDGANHRNVQNSGLLLAGAVPSR